MPFVQFIPEGEGKSIQASLTPKGVLFLSNDLLQQAGFADATHVFLFFDPDRRALGLRPAGSDQPGAVKLARRKRGASVQVGPLLEFYRLVVDGKLLLEPARDEQEDLLVLPLLGARMRPGRRPLQPKPVSRPVTRARKAAAPARVGTKAPAAETPAPAPSRRGRPATKEKAAAAEKPARRPGRPPKAAAEAPAPAARRGRPRKAAAEAPAEAPKRRGRPRKR